MISSTVFQGGMRYVRNFLRIWVFMGGAGLALCVAPAAGANQATPPLRVVASFSILGDMVREVGGDHIALSTIVGPDSDAHSFEPSPRNAKALAGAQLLVINGLDFEGWLPRLVESAGFAGQLVVATTGIIGRKLNDDHHDNDNDNDHDNDHDHDHGHDDHDHHAHGDIDPHAWQTLENGEVYVRNIAQALALADPDNAAAYQENAQAYIARLRALDTDIKAAIATIPVQRRKIITSHDAFGYFGQAYGIQFISAAGASSQAEPSARSVAALIERVRQEQIAAVFIENVTNAKLVNQIARETGAKVGGTLYSDALAQSGQAAGSYLGMFRWNADQLITALQ